MGSPDTVPATERYQFMGDPRYCPYLDVKLNNGYNWYFFGVNNIGGYSKFDMATYGWGPCGETEDVPRFLQLIREGVLKSQAFWSSMSGFFCYYQGFGGTIGCGYDIGHGIFFYNKSPFFKTSVSGESIYAIDETGYGSLRYVASRTTSWYARKFLGELYPDNYYSSNWKDTGNIPLTDFWLANPSSLGIEDRTCALRLTDCGASSFSNGIGPAGTGPFNQLCVNYACPSPDFGELSDPFGKNTATRFNYLLYKKVESYRPFTLDRNDYFGNEWNYPPYSTTRTTLSIPKENGIPMIFYNSTTLASSGYYPSGLTQITNAAIGTGFLLISGLAFQADTGGVQICMNSLVSMLQSFISCGFLTGDAHVTQVPYVEITKPKSSDNFDTTTTQVTIEWRPNWEKFNSGYSETTSLEYSVLYSNDGKTWYSCDNNSAVEPGTRKNTISDTSYTWSVPAESFPAGNYRIRIECYRTNCKLHYSYAQTTIYLPPR
jgi:hypothetical protein